MIYGQSTYTASAWPEAPVARFVNCKLGGAYHPIAHSVTQAGVGIAHAGDACEQIDLINCTFNECQTGFKGNGIWKLRAYNNDLQQIIGDGLIPLNQATTGITSIRPEATRALGHFRLNTMRNMADHPEFSGEHSDFIQRGTSSDTFGYFDVCEFNVSEETRLQVRDVVTMNVTAVPVAGASFTVKGTTFTFVSGAPANGQEVQIGATAAATATNMNAAILAFGFSGLSQSAVSGNTLITMRFLANQLAPVPTRTTSPAANITIGTPFRQSGGTQGEYADDNAVANIDKVTICCIYTANGGLTAAMYNGTTIFDRVTLADSAMRPLSATVGTAGFNFDLDAEPYASSGRKDNATSTFTINHTVRNTVLSNVQQRFSEPQGQPLIRRADGTYTGSNSSALTLANNRYVDWSRGSIAPNRPAAMLAGSFGTDTDPNGPKVTYTMQLDGLNTPQQFRQAMYAALKLSNQTDAAGIGATDPATWPSI